MSEVATTNLTVAVIGAGGKMGTRVSNNFAKSDYNALYVEASPAGQERIREAGRELSDIETASAAADVVILAVPDVILGKVSEQVVPLMKSGAIILTLDP
ncbi:MAG: NAD(P)-dependent oxidoreductase, partial [Mycetocola sp.]